MATVTNEIMSTAAQESIRIAEAYLPRASIKRKMALAHEICGAIELCQMELSGQIATDLKKLVDAHF